MKNKSAKYYGRVSSADDVENARTTAIENIPGIEVDFNISVKDVLDSYPFYALLVDEDHFILQANSAVLHELSMAPDEIVGQFCPAVVHGVQESFPGCPLEEAVERNVGVERDVFDDHSQRWLKSAIYPTGVFTKDGKQIFFHMVTDITDTKNAESELHTAYERLRRLSAYLESVREEERKKIVHDLHDETSQVLASLSAHLEAIMEALPDDIHKAQNLLKRAQKLNLSAFDEISRIIFELRPSLLDELGLVASIRSLLKNNLETAGISIYVKTSGRTVKLPNELEVTLFRIAQEAVSNILRHSGAKNAGIYIRYKKDSVRMHIADDGMGFDIEEAIRPQQGTSGIGLIGIKERVEILKGVVEIRSSPNSEGTEIDVEIPISSISHN